MKLPFDKIYCLHLAEDNNRKINVLNEIKKIHLENEVNFWYTTKKPINIAIGNHIQSLHTMCYDEIYKRNNSIYGAVFDCAYNHYSIIKQALLRGMDSILIIEDDIKFNDDLIELEAIISNIPKDYDVLKLHNTIIPYTSNVHDYNQYFLNLKENNNQWTFSTLCYALSKKGMGAIVNVYESKLSHFFPSDICLDVLSRLNMDIKLYSIKDNVFCQPNNDCKSHITYLK